MNKINLPIEQKVAGDLLAVVVGAVIGCAAWGSNRSAEVAVLLPLIVGLATTRLRAFLAAFAYLLAASRTAPPFIGSWFDGNLVLGVALVTGSSLLGGLAWSAGWTSSSKPWRKAAACVLGWTITLLPPVAIVVPSHPIIGWGFLVPKSGWVGVVLSAAVPALILYYYEQKKWITGWVYIGILLSGIALVGLSFRYERQESRIINDLVAVGTKWGSPVDGEEVISRMQRMGKTTRALAEDNLASVVIFPESILQAYDPNLFQILSLAVLNDAAAARQTVILGVDLPAKDGSFDSAAIAFYPDGKAATAVARQTAPFALWKPWKSEGSFNSNWTASNMLTLREGIRARVLFCYEEYIPVLSLINEATDDHQLVVILANTWAAKNPVAADIQTRHSEGIARLFGRRILKAENRPKVQAIIELPVAGPK